MFSYDFRRRGDKIIYGPTLIYRVLVALLFALLTVGLILVIIDGDFTLSALLPTSLIALLLLCLLYRDSFTFDNKEERITYTWGFGPFVKRELWSYSEVERIEITHFVKGIPETSKNQKASWRHKAQVVFALRFSLDDKKDIEIMGEKRSGGKVERNASYLAAFTGLALYVDRPRDQELHKRGRF